MSTEFNVHSEATPCSLSVDRHQKQGDGSAADRDPSEFDRDPLRELEQPETLEISGSFHGDVHRSKSGLGAAAEAERVALALSVGSPQHKEYSLFIALHQGRRLTALDESGLSDPFVTVHCFGRSFKSDIIYRRLNPVWHRGYLLKVLLPDPIEFAPPLLVQVWDFDPNQREVIGACYLSTADLVVEQLNVAETDPVWYPLFVPDPKDSAKQIEVRGQMLMSLQLVSGHSVTIDALNERLRIHDAAKQEEAEREDADRARKQRDIERAKEREQLDVVEDDKAPQR